MSCNPKTNPNPNQGEKEGAISLGGNCPDTFPHDFSYNRRCIFTKGVFTYCVITEWGGGGGVVSNMLIHIYGGGGGGGHWPYDISK